MTVDAPTIERIAERVVELLRAEAVTPGLVSAATVAETLGVSRAWVYEHADELGAVRLGDGDRPRLRFDPDRAREAMGWREGAKDHATGAGRRRLPRSAGANLLPIRGRAA